MSVLTLRTAHHGFIQPCLPARTAHPPLGPGWLHEIKYDGFRLMARRDGRSVRLLTRRGYDWTSRFRRIADAVASLRCPFRAACRRRDKKVESPRDEVS